MEFLYLHREFLWGVLIGSLLEGVGWFRDRWYMGPPRSSVRRAWGITGKWFYWQ
jgi:hypothetical protein